MKKTFATILTLVLLVTTILTGCGTKAASTTKEGNKGVLKVGLDATFQPFEYLENGKYKGFDVELVTALAKEMGYKDVEFVNTDFKGLIPGLMSKKFDVIASAMYVTDERKKTIDFSDSYYPGGLCIMVQKGNSSIKSIDDLKDKKVAVQVGTKSVKYLTDNCPSIKRVEVETNNEMFLQLETGKADAVITGRPAASVYAKTSGKVKVLDSKVTEELYAYGIRKEDKELMKNVNKSLATLKSNGVYNKIKAKYFN